MAEILAMFASTITETLPAYLKALPVPRTVDEIVAIDAEKVRL
jgi:hypothetical protein